MLKVKVIKALLGVASLILGTDSDGVDPSRLKDGEASAAPRRINRWQPYIEASYFHYLPH